jgi:hypothetical protein
VVVLVIQLFFVYLRSVDKLKCEDDEGHHPLRDSDNYQDVYRDEDWEEDEGLGTVLTVLKIYS